MNPPATLFPPAANGPEDPAHGTFMVAPDPVWVIQRAIEWDYPARPDEHALFLLNDTQYSPALGETFERSVRRIQSAEAVQRLGQIELDYDPLMEQLVVHEVGLWRGGQFTSYADPGRFHFRQREASLEQQILHGRVSAILILEDLRVGDVLELRYSLRSLQELPGRKMDFIFLLRRPLRTGAWHTAVWVPKNAPLPVFKTSDGLEHPPEALETDDEVIWVWSGREEESFEEEAGMPAWEHPLPWGHLSAYGSWEEAGAIMGEHWNTIAGEEEGLEELARGFGGPEEGAEVRGLRALRWAQEEVRYLGLESGLGGVLPGAPQEVLRRRFGDCKDKSLLLSGLLNKMGLEAHPVIVHTGFRSTIGEHLPGLKVFNHAIVRVRLGDRTGFVDPTMLSSGGDLFNQALPDYGYGLVISTECPGLVPVRCETQEKPSWVVREDVYLSAQGGLSVMDQCIEATGFEANLLRFRLAQVGRDGFAKAEAADLSRFFTEVVPDASREVLVEDERDRNYVRIESRYRFMPWPEKPTGGVSVFRFTPRWLAQFLASPGPQPRKTSFMLRHPLEVKHHIVVHGRFNRGQTEDHRVDGVWFSSRTRVAYESDGKVHFSYSYRSKAKSVAASAIRGFLKDFGQMTDRLGCNVEWKPGGRDPRPPEAYRKAALVAAEESNGRFQPPAARKWVAHEDPEAPFRRPSSFWPLTQRTKQWAWILFGVLLFVSQVVYRVVRSNENPSVSGGTVTQPPAVAPRPAISSAVEAPITDARMGLAEKALAVNDFATAATQLESMEKDYPGHSALQLGWTIVDIGQGRYGQAKARAQKIVQRYPGHPLARLLEVSAMVYGGELEPASVAAQAYLRDFPESADGWINLGMLRMKQERWEDSEKAWLRAWEMSPALPNTVASVAWLRAQKGDMEGALRFLGESVAKVPQSAPLHAIYGDYLVQAGRYDMGLEVLDQALVLTPGHPPLLAQKAVLLHRLSRKDESLEMAELALRLGPGQYEVNDFVGRVFAESARLEEAERLHRKCLEMRPNESVAHNSLGYTLFLRGKLEEARDCFDQAVKLSPNFVAAWENLANVSAQLGDAGREAEARKQLAVFKGQAAKP